MDKALDPILVVDDEKDNLEALQRLLRNQYAVTITTSPFEALKLMQKQAFHVIVSDQRMPEMTGVELLEKAKNVAPAATRILLTGYTDIESVIGAINRGNIYRYVAKPWDPEDLKLTLRQANDAYQLRRELDMKNEELAKSNQELQRALDEVRLLDRAKARFLQLVSHELNTPLTVLSGFVSLLSDKQNAFPKELEKAVAALAGASGRFTEIVGDVLMYVKLESGSQFHPRDFDLLAEAQLLKAGMKDALAKKKIALAIEGTAAPVKCDPEKMRAALKRLIDDALLRSPDGQEIKVAVSRADGKAVLTVSRKGETVSPEAFLPLEASGEEMHHGRNLGLGLAICRLIVQGHGGAMALDSTAKGTTITMTLPSP